LTAAICSGALAADGPSSANGIADSAKGNITVPRSLAFVFPMIVPFMFRTTTKIQTKCNNFIAIFGITTVAVFHNLMELWTCLVN
jgi:hypothetical protein